MADIKLLKIKLVKTLLLSQREIDLIMFCRKKMPYGRGILVTDKGQPVRVEEEKPTTHFGSGEKLLDTIA